MNEPTSMFLFRKSKKPVDVTMFMTIEDYNSKMEQQPDMLEFSCQVASPRELADAVRSDPLASWVLFRGQMVDVSVNIPVFVDGRNIETSNEWIT